jgi:hypothetical protein
MRRLQTSRPDLGPLPYSENFAPSEDLSIVWIFEGRGILPIGAHTAGHNRDGYGAGILGNHDLADPQAAAVLIEAIERRVRDLRLNHGLVNLGQVKNPRGWNAWGHRDSSPKSCPGNHLYPLLANFRLLGEDMASSAQKMLVDIAFNAGWAQGDANEWYNLPEDHPAWDTHFRPAISIGAQDWFNKLKGHPHGTVSGTVDNVARATANATKAALDKMRAWLRQTP